MYKVSASGHNTFKGISQYPAAMLFPIASQAMAFVAVELLSIPMTMSGVINVIYMN